MNTNSQGPPREPREISFRAVCAAWLAIYVLSIAVFFVLVKLSGRPDPIWGADGIKYYAYVRSVVLDRDLDFSREWQEHYAGHMTLPPKTATGHVPNKLPVGFSLLSAPFFLVGHLLFKIAVLLGYPPAADGYSPFHEYAVCIGSMTYGLIGIFLSRRLIRNYFGELTTFVAVTSLWLSTNLIYYFFKEPFMSHVVSMACVAAFLNLWHDGYGSFLLRRWLFLGLLSGLMCTVRLQNAVFLLLPAVELLWNIRSRSADRGPTGPLARSVRNALGFLAAGLAAFSPQLIAWKVIYGRLILFPYKNEWFAWAHPRIAALLFSTNHGLFFYAPVLVPAVLGLFFFRKRSPRFALYFLAALAVQVYVGASWWMWWLGISFGARGFIECMPLFFLGMAAFIDRFGFERRLKVFFPVLGLAVFYNGLLLLSYEAGLIPLEGGFSFIDWLGKLPELPRLVLERI
jgi:hypothetical protein